MAWAGKIRSPSFSRSSSSTSRTPLPLVRASRALFTLSTGLPNFEIDTSFMRNSLFFDDAVPAESALNPAHQSLL